MSWEVLILGEDIYIPITLMSAFGTKQTLNERLPLHGPNVRYRPKADIGGHASVGGVVGEYTPTHADGNVHKLQQWLDEIHITDGPKAAFDCYTRLLEYTVPKQARTELTSDNPIEHTFRWID